MMITCLDFYVEWLTTNYKGTKPLYLGISPQAWIVSAASDTPFPRLNCKHEEADDRMMFHLQDILSHHIGSTSLTLSSGDTDDFVCLLYHISQLEKSWPPRALAHPQLRSEKINITTPDICIALAAELTQCLPALHALTGCDTTSKISTKLAALKTVRKPENYFLILNFSCPQLTESAIQMAETLWRHLTTCALLRSIVMPLRWTLRGPLAPQLMQENIYKEPIINSSFGSKHHLETPTQS